MKPWTWRQTIAHYIHKLAFMFVKPKWNDLVLRDKDGKEIFSISFEGGFVASGPMGPEGEYR